VNNAQLESGVINLICSLIVSARGLVDEPKIYGPLRLMEATQRVVNLAEECSIRNELLTEVAKRIEEYNLDYFLAENEEGFIRFMDDLVVLLATWVGQS
jgi:hypothetical protein